LLKIFNVDGLLLGLYFLQLLGLLFDVVLQFLVLLFLLDKLLDQLLPLVLLLFVLGFELCIFAAEVLVLAVDSLGDVRDQVQVVLDGGLLLLEVVSLVAGFHALLLYGLFGLGDLRAVLPADLLELLSLELLDFFGVPLNVLVNFSEQLEFGSLVSLERILFVAVTNAELPLQLFDFVAVVSLIMVVTFHAPCNFNFHFFVFGKLLLVFCDEVAVHLEPLVFLDLTLGQVKQLVWGLKAVF